MLLTWLRQFSVHPDAAIIEQLAALAEHHDADLQSECLYRGYAHYGVITKAA